MKSIFVAIFAVALTGCASNNPSPSLNERYWDVSILENTLNNNKGNAVFICKSPQQCEKAFNLAKAYVQENSELKIETSNDTLIATYGPPFFHDVGLTVTKTPLSGDSTKIELVASCPGINMRDSLLLWREYRTCARRMSTLYLGFNLFISSRL